MTPVSVILLAMNEEENIARCLESVRWADEVVVLDSGSTDRTVEIARTYGAKVHTIEWPGYGIARTRATEKATGEWIFWIDADEEAPPELGREIRAIVDGGGGEFVAYSVARRAFFLDRWIRHCGWYPSRVVRLFRKDRGRFTESRVHERLIIDGPAGTLRCDLLHFTDPTLHHYFTKFNRYTSLGAEDMDSGGRKFGIGDLLVRPLFQFLKMYILRRGFLDGIEGFILCVVSSGYVFTKYAKLWERQRPKTI